MKSYHGMIDFNWGVPVFDIFDVAIVGSPPLDPRLAIKHAPSRDAPNHAPLGHQTCCWKRYWPTSTHCVVLYDDN